MARRAAAPGLAFVEGIAKGRFVTYDLSAEVLRAYRNIERDFPRLQCLWDQENREHLILEHCSDHELRAVLTSKTFYEDNIRSRLARADSTKFDPIKEIEEAEEAMERAHDERMHELIGAAGEKLAHAFAQDGLTVRPRMVPVSMRMQRRKSLRNYEAPTRSIKNR